MRHTARETELLERERELAAVAEAVRRACEGDGGTVLVEGPAGIGKSSVLSAAAVQAERAGMTVLDGRGGEFEHEMSYGVARQLFEPRLAQADADERETLMQGPAGPAVRALLPTLALGEEDDPAAIPHGLYRLCAAWAAEQPLALLIDDVQWADDPSLAWVAYVARRLRGTPLLPFLGRRTGDPEISVLLEEIRAQPTTICIRPQPLSRAAVGWLIHSRWDRRPEPKFVDTCHQATGGNPFYVRELMGALLERGAEPSDVEAAAASELRPEAITSSVLNRLARLGHPAPGVARAAAVLGPEVDLRLVAKLANLRVAHAGEAADLLAAAEILRPGRPLDFVHPIVRAVVYGDTPDAERAEAHRAAAKMFLDEGELAVAAAHLLSTEPAGDPWVVETLRRAAAVEPAPEIGARYLRRALSEPPGRARLGVLKKLGEVEAAGFDPAAIPHLEEAFELAEDVQTRAEIALALGTALFWSDRRAEGKQICERAMRELQNAVEHDADGPERELHLLLQARLLALEIVGYPGLAGFQALCRVAAPGRTRAEKALLAPLAVFGTSNGLTAQETIVYAERALAGGDLLKLPDPLFHYMAIWALEFADDLEAARRHHRPLLRTARERNSPSALAFAHTYEAVLAMRFGEILLALREAETGLALAREHDLGWVVGMVGPALLDALLERDRVADAEQVLPVIESEGGLAEGDATAATRANPSTVAYHRHIRGRLRLAQNRPTEALRDFEAAGELLREVHFDQPGYYPWRSGAALAAIACDDKRRARALAREELELAKAAGAARSLGTALRTAGVLETGEKSLALLDESVAVLERSSAALERARSGLELGAALRRAGRRRDAQVRLREALELGTGCGSEVIRRLARTELVALGLKPRRDHATGVAALTPRERQVAELAANGLTNTEIGHELVISVRTVERHMGNIFDKLEIRSRGEIAERLG